MNTQTGAKVHEEEFCYRHVEQDKERWRTDCFPLPSPKYLVKNKASIRRQKSCFLEDFVKSWNTGSAFFHNQVTKGNTLRKRSFLLITVWGCVVPVEWKLSGLLFWHFTGFQPGNTLENNQHSHEDWQKMRSLSYLVSQIWLWWPWASKGRSRAELDRTDHELMEAPMKSLRSNWVIPEVTENDFEQRV